ncbi:MAG: AraC family transcriptional regulator, partial [Leptospira sp.]|nr:AraC family transcriptional regulator [Leptospira sp.]
DYDRIRNTLRNFIDNKLIEQKVKSPIDPKAEPIDILEVHDDNYGFITNGRISLLEESNTQIKKDDANKLDSVPERPDKPKQEQPK